MIRIPYSGWLGRPSPIEGVDRPSHISFRSSLAFKGASMFWTWWVFDCQQGSTEGIGLSGVVVGRVKKRCKPRLGGFPVKKPRVSGGVDLVVLPDMGMAQFYHRRYAKFTCRLFGGDFLLWLVVAELSKTTCAQKCSTLSVYVTSLPNGTEHGLNVFCWYGKLKCLRDGLQLQMMFSCEFQFGELIWWNDNKHVATTVHDM